MYSVPKAELRDRPLPMYAMSPSHNVKSRFRIYNSTFTFHGTSCTGLAYYSSSFSSATTSLSSVLGWMNGLTVLRACVSCSSAYAMPINFSSEK